MATGRAYFLAFGLILAGILFIGTGLQKQVTVLAERKSLTGETYALTVGEYLRASGVTLYEGDSLVPDWNHWLRNGDKILIRRAAQVVILANQKVYRFTSQEKIPANLFLQAGIPLYPGDLIFHQGEVIDPGRALPQERVYALQLKRASSVTYTKGSSRQAFSANASSLGRALWDAGIYLQAKDQISLPLDTPLRDAQVISVQPAQEITIKTSDQEMKTLTNAKTIGAALAEAGQPLQGLDYSLPAAEQDLPADGVIRVVRVDEQVLLETSSIPFDTETQPVADLELDQQAVVSEGSLGLKIRRIRVRSEDGEEVSRDVEDEYTALEPQPRILGYGTQVVPHTLDTPDGPIKYWRALNMYAVSYNPTSNGGTGTASGIPLAKGVAAVDLDYIPFYTRLYIPGYGHAVAADVGGGVQGRMIDLGYSDKDYVSWHQWVTVYFLWPPPATIPWTIP